MKFSHTKTTKWFAIKNQKGVKKIKQKADMVKQWLRNEKTFFRKLKVCTKQIERIVRFWQATYKKKGQ